MPIYEYQCENCGHHLEKLQRMSDDPIKDCPACETPALRKLVSAAAFKLKGTGWYETDFKDNNKKDEKKANKPAEKKDAAAKPAAKKEAKADKKPTASS